MIVFYFVYLHNNNNNNNNKMKPINQKLKKSGIYCLINLSNNKRYIGSSKNIYSRLLKHRSLLRNNKHENSKLQNS